MKDVYARFAPVLQQHFSSGGGGGGAPAVSNAADHSALSTPDGAPPAAGPAAAQVAAEEGTAWAVAQDLVRGRVSTPAAPAVLLQQVEGIWPAWSAASCRLPASRQGERAPAAGASAGAVPTAEEAAAALQLVARQAQRLPRHQRQQELAKSRVVRGLVQALRLPPPSPDAGSPNGAGASLGGSSCGALSADAVAAALWSLATLGGSIFWEAEAAALCARLPACRFARLRQVGPLRRRCIARSAAVQDRRISKPLYGCRCFHSPGTNSTTISVLALSAQVSDVAWALATMRHDTPHLPQLEQQAAALLQRLLEAACADGAASAGGSGGGDRGAPVSLRQLTSLLWGLATLGHRPLRLYSLLPDALRCQLAATADTKARFSSLCTLGWSLAASGCAQHPAAEAVAADLARAAGSLPAGAATRPLQLQLHQFVLALQAAAGEAAAQELQLSSGGGSGGGPAVAAAALHRLRQEPAAQQLLAAAAEAWAAEGRQRGGKLVSACQADVAATAVSLGLTIQEEHSVAGFSGAWPGCWAALGVGIQRAGLTKLSVTALLTPPFLFPACPPAVDIAVPSRRLAIEVDGPSHFCRNICSGSSGSGGNAGTSGAAPPEVARRPLGATLLKRRLLRQQGWAVASVDAAAWEGLRGAAQKRAALAVALAAAEAGAEAGEA